MPDPAVPARDRITTNTMRISVHPGHIMWTPVGGTAKLVESPRRGLTDDTVRLLMRQKLILEALLRLRPKFDGDEDALNDLDSAAQELATILGEHLYRVLFLDDIDAALQKELEATSRTRRLRVELEFCEGVPNLEFWPWEYLCVPGGRSTEAVRFLAMKAQLVLYRRHDSRADTPLETGSKLTVLLVVARALGHDVTTPRLTAIGEACKQADKAADEQNDGARANVRLVEIVEPSADPPPDVEDWKPTATYDAVEAAVRLEDPHIIHFAGHGRAAKDGGELALVKDGREADWIDEERFAKAITGNENLKLVFLDACEGATAGARGGISSMARRLAHVGVPAVIAMQSKITNTQSDLFGEAFYKALVAGEEVDLAVQKGREALHKLKDGGRLSFGIPVLYLRNNGRLVDPSQLFAPPPPPPTSRTPTSSRERTVWKEPSRPKCPYEGCGFEGIRPIAAACTKCTGVLRCENCGELYCDGVRTICDICSAPVPPRVGAPPVGTAGIGGQGADSRGQGVVAGTVAPTKQDATPHD